VYQQIGGHAYGSVYPGPIGAVITPQLMGIEKTSQLPYASSLCGACREVCPVKIDIPRLLLHLRHEITENQPHTSLTHKRRGEKLAFRIWQSTMLSPRLYNWSSRIGRFAQRLVVHNGVIGKVGLVASRLQPLRAWTEGRDLRPIEQMSFRQQWRQGLNNRRG
jgi:L-lactate dehydrogenase complex protein LldF